MLFVDSISNSGLLQISDVKNSLNRQLDLVFSTSVDNCIVTESNLVLSNIDPYHPPISLTFSFDRVGTNVDAEIVYRLNFHKADFDKLDDLLTSIDFESFLNQDESIDISTSMFYSRVLECCEQSVPYSPQS